MQTLRLLRGDLVLTGSEFQMVAGEDKIQQDLRGGLIEPLGNDRFHPGWGSVLNRFIGIGVVNPLNVSRVAQEITRVIQNYVAVQRDNLQRDAMSGKQSRYTTADVIRNVEGVSMSTREDKVYGTIKLSTYGAYNINFTMPVASA